MLLALLSVCSELFTVYVRRFLKYISFIIGHPSRVRHGKHFYACAARIRHEINLRGALYKLAPEYFVNSLLVFMTRPRRAYAFAQSHQGPAAH